MAVERKASVSSYRQDRIRAPRPHTRVEDEAAVEKKYAFGNVLGQGSFGVVKEVTCKTSEERFAVKIVNKDKPGSSNTSLLTREVEVLKILDHPHIIKLEEVLESPKRMYLVMELCAGGELTAKLKEKGYLREEEAKEVMKQLADVLFYLHENNIVHRDLKLENILLKSIADSTDSLDIKVTDFGLAYMRNLSDLGDPMDQQCGTPYFMAPEVISSRHGYTKMCDVWSLGVIMYYLLCGRVPFQGDTVANLKESIHQAGLIFGEVEWISVSDNAKLLIKGMLCKDTAQRLTARRVLNDTWFTGQSSNFLNAIDLMRDMTSDSDRHITSNSSYLDTIVESDRHITRSSSSLETVIESETFEKEGGKEIKKAPTRRISPNKLTADKRTQSSTVLTHSSHQLKLTSTTTPVLSSSDSQRAKQRSHSVGTRPTATVPSRRQGHNHNTPTHHKDRKHPSRTQ